MSLRHIAAENIVENRTCIAFKGGVMAGRKAHSLVGGTNQIQDVEERADDAPPPRDDELSTPSSIPNSTRNTSTTHFRSLKRSAARGDIYEIFSEDKAEIRVNNPKRRSKRNTQAKTPIVAPIISQGTTEVAQSTSLEPTKRGRGRPRKTSKPIPAVPATSVAKRTSPLANSSEAEDRLNTTNQPAKRGRGRPPKNSISMPDIIPKEAVRRIKQIPALPQKPVVPNKATVSEEGSGAEDAEIEEDVPVDEEETRGEVEKVFPADEARGSAPETPAVDEDEDDDQGYSQILMNPSPIKVTGQNIVVDSNHAQQNLEAISPNQPEGEALDKEATESEAEEDWVEENGAGEDETEDDLTEVLFNNTLLESVARIARRVGHRQDTKTRKFHLRQTEKMMTTNGKKMIKSINKLVSAYGILRNNKNKQEPTECINLVASLIREIKLETESILKKRLGNPSIGIEYDEEARSKKMLRDLYFNIFPPLVDVIQMAVDVHPAVPSIETPALQQLLDLVTCLEQLATAAILQPKEHQPRAPGNSMADSYQITQPTRHFLPNVRLIRKILSAELDERGRIEAAKKREQRQHRQRQIDEEREKRRQADLHARIVETNRLQREAFNKRLEEPRWGQILSKIIAAKTANGTQNTQSMYRAYRSDEPPSEEYFGGAQDNDSQNDPFAEDLAAEEQFDHFLNGHDDAYDRVRVFGRNNMNDKSRPLSDEERQIFIECMRKERGEDRYVKAAQTLQRSVEEIFLYAQDLQEAMDRKHAQGWMKRPKDEWTNYIWAKEPEPSTSGS
ncbi:uncharacterized protein L3040_001538 [Drepanopeziza brunnea f. sp. 'multigermtubi']|uniref:uncharacterized protein n=1 Tax=Drepanopeziza brunnea f. sp. 'multigermtubi' TaxID=698441 RepID=UPI0023A77646|nr:hypothetical protein L3040_001538 [Drepanopeziza brunnea f. sp. 'multigermtubi']